MQAKGSCLCKSVRFSFKLKAKHFDACHCSMCRKWSGSPVMSVESDGEISFEGEESISVFSSSDWAERGFCSKCGTNLFYRIKDPKYKFCNFWLGTIEGHEEFEFTSQIFTDNRPSNYEFKNDTKMMTEQEVLELFQS